MRDDIFSLERISQRFERDWALIDIQLSLARGEALALIGPNGCGKTTLLKILATLFLPSIGEGQILGRDLRRERKVIRKEIGWLGHESHLYPYLTGRENLRFFLALQGKKASQPKMEIGLERVGLISARNKLVSTYSTGMKKRLTLARLLLQSPALILMDEPHANLDEGGRILLNELIKEWKRESKSLVMASHDYEEILPLSDWICSLKEGRVHRFEKMERR